MTTAHDVPRAIQWHEGMLLAPQHIQQLSLRQEQLLHYHAQMFAPFHWGVRHLKVDPVLLVDGTFRVLELEAVMPDGLLVSHPPDEGSDLTLDLSPHLDELREARRTLQLVVPAMRRRGSAVRGEMARYDSVEGSPVVDENSGEGDLRIPRLVPRLSLLLAKKTPAKYASLPLARVVYRDETYSLTDYIPPTLRVARRSAVAEICESVASRVREKAVMLSEQVTAPTLARGAPQLLHTRIMVHGLVAALPPFEALLGTGTSHPFPLYLALCSLVGQVAAVGAGLIPPVLEPYDHTDLRSTFDQARTFIFQALEEGIVEAYTPHLFLEQKDTFSIHFDAGWMDRALVLGVRAATGASEDEISAWISESIIGSSEKISSMRQKRILGASRSRIEGGALLPARGVLLFELQPDPEFVEADQSLMILNLSDPGDRVRPVEIVLYVEN